MSKRHSAHSVLHIAVLASALVSVGIATATTAQLIRSRHMHGSAPAVAPHSVLSEQEKHDRVTAAAKEKAERQDAQADLDIRNLRLGQ